MRLRTMRRLLWAAGSLAVVSSIATLGYGIGTLASPLPLPTISALGMTPRGAALTPPHAAEPESLNALVQLGALNLRRPLYDAPPPPAAEKPPPAPLTIKLAGTIVEPGHNRAVFFTHDGKLQLKSVGESLGGAEVLRIGIERVMVRYQDQELELTVDKRKLGG